MRFLLKIIVLGLVTFLVTSCSLSPHAESTGEYIDSAAITAKVKASLVDDLGSSGFAIRVKTYKDEVQLSGFVDTPRIKQRAASIAAGVAGVRGVSNALLVKSS